MSYEVFIVPAAKLRIRQQAEHIATEQQAPETACSGYCFARGRLEPNADVLGSVADHTYAIRAIDQTVEFGRPHGACLSVHRSGRRTGAPLVFR